MTVGFEPGKLCGRLDASMRKMVEAAGCAAAAGEGCVTVEVPAKSLRFMLARP